MPINQAWCSMTECRDFGAKSAMSLVDVADRLIGDEMARSRIKRPDALARVARAAGLMPGTVANLLRGRLKYAERAERALTSLLATSIERKITELETELAALRAGGADALDPDILGATGALEAARAYLGRARK